MRRFLAVLGLVLAFVATQASAQTVTTYTFATLPGSPTAGQLAYITDSSTTETVGSPAAGGGANKDLVAYDATQTRWEFVQRIPTSGSGTPLQTYLDAERVGFVSSLVGWAAANVRIALDYLYAQISKRDADGNGLYEYAVLWDADGDGSGKIACFAKDNPSSQCKANGEVLFPDFADDLNCAMHGCGFGQMELTGSIRLEARVAYMNFPCWKPSGPNQPGSATDDAHDGLPSLAGEAAWSDCPADPGSSRRLGTIATMGWQGSVVGSGVDTRNPATTASYSRNVGTYIVNDMGPAWNTGAQSGLNSWWGAAGFVRGFNFGFGEGYTASATAYLQYGESAADGDSKGYGTVSGNQLISAMDSVLCAANTTGLNTLVAGDVIIVQSSPETATTSAFTVSAVRVRDVPTGTCNAGAGIPIPLGGRVFTSSGVPGTNANYYGADLPFTLRVYSGALVMAARSNYLQGGARLSNVRMEPQDWWGETGGDCTPTLTNGPWTFNLDGAATDIDCDTNPQIGLFGGGTSVVEDVVFANWHSYAIDGDSNVGNPIGRRLRFFFGRGGPIADWGTGWNFRDIEIRNSEVGDGSFVSTFGPGVRIDGIRAYNISGQSLIDFGTGLGNAVGNVVQNVSLESSPINHTVILGCGARLNTIEGIEYENPWGLGTTNITNGYIALLTCSNASNPIEHNVIRDFRLTGVQPNGGGSMVAVLFDTGATRASPNTTAISGNFFEGGRMKMVDSSASSEACMFGALDSEVTTTRATGPNYTLEDVFGNQAFYGNSVINTGGGADWMYCNCRTYLGSATDAWTCTQAVGSGAGSTVNPRGCLNFDKNAKPANETCS